MWYSDDSSDVIKSNSDQLSEDETMVGSAVHDEESDESILHWTLQMCENCHQQPLFDHHTGIPVTGLPYYLILKKWKEILWGSEELIPISMQDIMMMTNLFFVHTMHCLTYSHRETCNLNGGKFPG